MDSSSSSSSFPLTSSIKDEDRGEMLQLDPDDEHYFQNYNHFAALDEQGSSVDEPVNIKELIEEYERLHPNSISSSSISSSSGKSVSERSSKSIQVSVQQHSTYFVTPTDINFREINRSIKAFLKDPNEMDSLALEPMPAVARKFIHELAQMYQMKTKSVGKDDNRYVKIMKTENSRLPNNFKRLGKLLEQAKHVMKYARDVPHRRDWKSFGKRKTSPMMTDKKALSSERKAQTRLKPGTIVGEDAAPIGGENRGMQMLQKMGWNPGTSLGQQPNAITSPIEAIVRSKRKGL
jgi:R3H domain-containing protein/G-patch protein